MAEHDDNAGLPLRQTQLLKEQLTKLEDRIHQLRCSYQFYDSAVRAMARADELRTEIDNEDYYFGLHLNQQWLRQQGEDLTTELIITQQMMRP